MGHVFIIIITTTTFSLLLKTKKKSYKDSYVTHLPSFFKYLLIKN